ncbi:MAG: thiosulfate oxidation carrier protein SoxY [Chromatiales bacterium]|nr:thiosulfate oxidation carrier protein SoxY [Chromatiales bacterium]
MDKTRRKLLVGTSAGLLLASWWPQSLFATRASEVAFGSKALDESIKQLIGDADVIEDQEHIHIKAPTISENGAVVPISVEVDLDNVDMISLLVEQNPLPLTSNYQFHKASAPYVSTRIKMLKTSNVVALVTADGKHYKATELVKVTIGGCGG